jgi:hypothetical protein
MHARDDFNKKSGGTIAEALESKHANARIPDVDLLPKYTITPGFVNVDICEESIKTVA